MSGTCETCEHWKHLPWGDADAYVTVPEGYGLCEMTANRNVPNSDSFGVSYAERMNSKAIALDGDDYAAVLATAAGFGCNQYSS